VKEGVENLEVRDDIGGPVPVLVGPGNTRTRADEAIGQLWWRRSRCRGPVTYVQPDPHAPSLR
jgi:hypothetical protein